MKYLKTLNESDRVASVLVLNLLSLVPWLAVFWHSSAEMHGDDGPAAMFSLIVSAVSTIFVLPFYIVSSILMLRFQPGPALRLTCAISLLIVLGYCVGSSCFWGYVGLDGETLFLVSAFLYAVFSLKIIKELILVVRQKSASKVERLDE